MGLNTNYVVGILDDSFVIPNATAAQKSKELTECVSDPIEILFLLNVFFQLLQMSEILHSILFH